MGCIAKKRGIIDSMLNDGLKTLNYKEKISRYENEFKQEIIKLLKDCYPDTLADKIIFYDECFKSLIGFYDSQLLIENLFLEKDSISISNHLLRIGSFKGINSKYLSQFTDEYIVFLTNKFEQNSKLIEEDENKFIQVSFQSIIDELNDFQWVSMERSNELIKTFIKWIDSNLDDSNATTSFLIFTKLWNNNSNFEKSFNNKSIILYNELIIVLKKRRDNSEVESIIKLIDMLNGFQSLFFNNSIYFPIIDNKVSNKYAPGYIERRNEYLIILEEAKMIDQINNNLNYYELFKLIKDDSPEYLKSKINKVINNKITSFNYPTSEEVLMILELKSNYFIENLRNKLIKQFYLYEYIKFY